MATCGARTKRCRKCGHRFPKEEYDLWNCPECGEDRHCRRTVKEEGQRCKLHGGASPRGVASPHFKHGRRCKYLPTRLMDRYQEALADPDLIALRDDIALLETHLGDLIAQLETGESSTRWDQLGATYEELKIAQSTGNVVGTIATLDEIGRIIKRGGEDRVVWSEIYHLLDRKRLLAEAERKRLVEMRQMVTAEQMANLMAAVIDVIYTNVTDRDILRTISDGLRSLANGRVLERDRGRPGPTVIDG